MSDINKNIKELTGAISKLSGSSRLSSFRGARDLSLPGPSTKATTKPRKIFKPNIVPRRTKNDRDIEEALKNHGKTLKKSDQAAFRGKPANKSSKQFIQIKGSLFDEKGLTAHKLMHSAGVHKRVTAAQEFTKDVQVEVEPEDNASCEDFLSRMSGIDKDENDDFDCGLVPHLISKKTVQSNSEHNVDLIGSFKELQVKTEPSDEATMEKRDLNSNIPKTIDILPKTDMSLGEKILNNSEDIFCFNLPGVLPGILENCGMEKKTEGETQNTPLEDIAVSQLPKDRFSIKHVSPGQIGKMRVYKSGKVELVLNGHRFETWETPSGKCHEELAYIETAKDKNSGRMSIFGKIGSSYSFVPNIASMVQEKKLQYGS